MLLREVKQKEIDILKNFNIIKFVLNKRSDSSAGEYVLDRDGVGGSNPSQVIKNPNIYMMLGFFYN
jgi:hypothetical protein